MGSLTKADMAERLSNEQKLSKRDAKEMVEAFFDEVSSSLINNEQVKLSGFGNFDLRDKRSRPGRNPKTGEEAEISARKVVRFKSGKHFKQAVNDENGS